MHCPISSAAGVCATQAFEGMRSIYENTPIIKMAAGKKSACVPACRAPAGQAGARPRQAGAGRRRLDAVVNRLPYPCDMLDWVSLSYTPVTAPRA